MKPLLVALIAALLSFTAALRAASDADVTLLKTKSVHIESNVITIVAEAKTSITLIKGDYDPAYKGDNWMGRPVSRVTIKSDRATFIIKKPTQAALAEFWKTSLRAAEDLRDGKEVGRIGYYAPDMIIKENLLTSMTGYGFLYAKGQQ